MKYCRNFSPIYSLRNEICLNAMPLFQYDADRRTKADGRVILYTYIPYTQLPLFVLGTTLYICRRLLVITLNKENYCVYCLI